MKKKMIVVKETETSQTGFYIVKSVDENNNESVLRCFSFNNEYGFIDENTQRENAINFAKSFIKEQTIVFEREYSDE